MSAASVTPEKLLEADKAFAASRNLSCAALDDLHHLRLTQKNVPTPLHQLAVWVVAPVLAGFAHWIEEQAKQQAQPCLLGVMREGRFLSRLMQSLCGMPAREIWLNRNLSMLAAFGCGDDEALVNWLVRTRLQPLNYAEATRLLLGKTDTASDAQKPIDLAGAYALMERWRKSGELEGARKRGDALANKILRHWHNTVTPAAPVVLMDFACAGNIQRSLQTIFVAKNVPVQLVGLNFATTAGSSWAEKAGCVMQGWLAERGEPKWFADAYARAPEVMEIFTAAAVGSLDNYNENAEPVYGDSFLSKERQTLLHDLQQHILTSAVFYYRELGGKLTGDMGRCLWGRLLLQPFAPEAHSLGDWPLDAGLDGSVQRTLAPDLQGQRESWTKMQTAWPAASAIRT